MTEAVDRTSLIFDAGSSPWLFGIAVLAVVVLSYLGIRAVTNQSRGRKAVLVSLRVLLALSVVTLALRPMVRKERLAVSAAPVAVVVDTSASMAVRDQGGARSRLEAVSDWLATHEEELDRLEGLAVVDWFTASDGALQATTRLELASGVPSASGGTDLGQVFASLAERYPGAKRPGVLLLSDGADRGELGELLAGASGRVPDLASSLGEGGAIVSIAPTGTGFADLALDLMAHDPVAFLRTQLTVRARVRSVGLPAAEVPVSLMRGDEVVQVRTLNVGGNGANEVETTFRLEPVQVGEVAYRLQVPSLAGEAVSTNNEATFSVRVVRDRIRVLQIAGRPSWDGRFLRELLKRDPAIDLISFFILRSQWDEPLARVSELSLIPFPVDELFGDKLDGFDLVIFQNFNFRPYGIERHLGAVARHVKERGGGLLIVGGDLAFGPDYRGSELASVLPVDVPSRVTWQAGPVRASLTDAGVRHPVTRLVRGEKDPGAIIAGLLPLEGRNVGLTAKAEAQVLLESDGGGARPLVVAGDFGEGRTLVLATDGSWRWSLPMASVGRSPRSYERFWEDAIHWLIRDPRSELLLLEADRRTIGPGQTAAVRLRVLNERYEPESAVRLTALLRDADGQLVQEEELFTNDEGVASFAAAPELPGLYSVSVTSSRGEAGPLHIERLDRSQELVNAAVDEPLLQALAAASGGSVARLDEAFPRLPFERDKVERVVSASVMPLWSTWPAWALVASLFSLEWWLRRRWGLA